MPHATLTRESVASHNTPEDLWCIIDHKVYDLSDFVDAHPGGSVVLEQVAGQDATTAFYNLHRQEVLEKYSELCIGTIEGEKSEVIIPQPGDLSPVPYAEPLWLRPQFKSPYFKDSHRALQKEIRKFVDTHITPEAQQKEKDGTYISQELIDKMAENDMLAMRLGPGKHLHGKNLMGVVKGEEFDYLHDLVQAQEGVRANARGFQDGNMAGMMISLTAVLQWMPESEHKTRWITNGMFCDYFVTGCKTDKGFSVLLIERDEAVETKLIKTSYSTTAGTAFVEFNDAKVPVHHLLGEEHKGFIVIMSNFNHERFVMSCAVIRQSRTIVEECLKWCNQRIVFGKKLIEQPAIRQKLAKMISHVEANQAWLESIAFQMTHMSYAQQSKLLGGPIGLLKSFATRSAHEIADEAVNIFGGRGLTQGGMGRVIEQFHRTYKFDAILGGTEEILGDLGVRQAMKNFPKSML
ncbi:acyl-CoA dehydrogenase [Pyrenophora tritici-repentis]|nr:acyl-CoA dehydrogenase [Pyrenophora tritici-repentis]